MIGTTESLKDSLILDVLEWLYIKGSSVNGIDEEIQRKLDELHKIIEIRRV